LVDFDTKAPVSYVAMFRNASIFFALLASLVVAGSWSFFGEAPPPAQTSVARVKPSDDVKVTRPVIVCKDRNFDLGLMNPGDRRQHRFTVQNRGTAELTLELESTTCKCTLAKIAGKRIPPGGSDHIDLAWHAEQPQFKFVQGATIRTNDPDVPLMELVGEGSVRVKVGEVPEDAYVSDVPRNTERTLTVLFYSQAYRDVSVRKIESSNPMVSADVSSAAPQAAALPPETRFARDLTITIKPRNQLGHHSAVVRVDYVGRAPDGTEETGVCDLPIAFDVVGDFSVHGRDVVGKTLMFGQVPQRTGAKKQIYLHVRGANAEEWHLSKRRTTPDFLRVSIGAGQQLTPTIARFPLTVEIPAEAPQIACLDEAAAEIELATTSPDQPTVRFLVSFVVAP
jgi:hypothetical protein